MTTFPRLNKRGPLASIGPQSAMGIIMFTWIINLIYDIFGLANKSGNVLFLGLDFAGKTTMMNLLKTDKMTCNAPTAIGTKEQFWLNTGGRGTLKLTSIDLGGHQQLRRLWKDYFYCADAIVFIVDATDRNRLGEAAAELNGVLDDPVLSESYVPVIVLANKIDLPTAMGESELIYALNLYEKRSGKTEEDSKDGRPVELFMCSLLKRQGYGEAFRWLAKHLK